MHLLIATRAEIWTRKLAWVRRISEKAPVFRELSRRSQAVARRAAMRLARHAREAIRPKSLVGGFLADMTRSREELLAENAALRLQLIVASRKVKRPQFRSVDRFLLVLAAALTRTWRDSLILVKPETVLRWHRKGFRLFWKRKSQTKIPMARISSELAELIRRMARENRLWGAERIRGELLKLGFRVAKRTVQRHMRVDRTPGDGQGWSTFLRNHTVWACDFLQTYDCFFRPIFAFFIVDLHAKRVVHVGVTRAPNEECTAQRLRQVTPFEECAQVLIRDRDAKFGAEFDRVAHGVGMRVVKTAVRTPDMNAVCERFLGSVRRECVDHVLILSETHLDHVLREYAISYFNAARPHQGLGQRVPAAPEYDSYAPGRRVVALSVLGGLHHDYCVAS